LGVSVGSLNISNVDLTGTGGLFRAESGGTLNVTFDTASTTSFPGASSHAIFLNGATTGTFTVSGGAISGVAGSDVFIIGRTATLNIPASITNTSDVAIEVTGRTANNVTFSGALSSTGSATAISVHDNTGGTIAFTNASKVFNTGTATAVNLQTNTGATI